MMLEEGSQKILDIISVKLNGFFSRKPVASALILSLFVSLAVFLVGINYKKGSTNIALHQESADNEVVAADSPTSVQASVQVDLAGGFRNPGVYSLPSGSRVSNALALAGGLSPDSCGVFVSKSMNLSEVLSDGTKIYIPFTWETALCNLEPDEALDALALRTASASFDSVASANEAALIDVNDASETELDSLPGIGKTYAKRIEDGRPYVSFADFKARSRLPEALAGSLEGLVKF